MNNLYRNKTIRGFIDIIPESSKEKDMLILGRKIGLSLEEIEKDEFIFFDGEAGGFSIQFQLNYDWDLKEAEKKNIGLDIISFWDDRKNAESQKTPSFLKNIPKDIPENEHGDIDISEYLAEAISKLTGYHCLWEWPDD